MEDYTVTCDCGHEHEFKHNGPRKPNVSPPFREVCSGCGEVMFGRFERPDGKKVRKMQDNTFRIQAAILSIFDELQPRLTNRGIFYAAEVRDIEDTSIG